MFGTSTLKTYFKPEHFKMVLRDLFEVQHVMISQQSHDIMWGIIEKYGYLMYFWGEISGGSKVV